MNAKLAPLALICLTGFLWVTGCSPRKPPVRQPDKPISLESFAFQDPRLEQELQSVTQAIEKIADEKWERKPWHADLHSNDCYRLWCSSVGVIEMLNKPPERLSQESYLLVRLNAYVPHKNAKEITSIDVESTWQAPPGIWGASVSYGLRMNESTKSINRFQFIRYNSANPRPEYEMEMIEPRHWLDAYSAFMSFDSVDYSVRVSTRPDSVTERATIQDFLRWHQSARALHDDWHLRLTKLEEQAKKDITSGKAFQDGSSLKPDPPMNPADQGMQSPRFRSVPALIALLPGREVANVPPPFRYHSSRKVTTQERQQVLKIALQEISQRKQQLEDEYQEMHAALVKAFPFSEFLQEKDPALE